MHIDFTFRNFEPSEHLKRYARKRLEKVGRFLGKSPALNMEVILLVDKIRQRAEINLTGDGLHITAEEHSNDMYATIDLVADKVESQVRKLASKSSEGRRKAKSGANLDFYSYEVAEENSARIVNDDDHYAAKPMSVEESLLQLENSKHEFLVFLNSDLDRINVIYKKSNGDFGIIDPIS